MLLSERDNRRNSTCMHALCQSLLCHTRGDVCALLYKKSLQQLVSIMMILSHNMHQNDNHFFFFPISIAANVWFMMIIWAMKKSPIQSKEESSSLISMFFFGAEERLRFCDEGIIFEIVFGASLLFKIKFENKV